MTSKWPLNDLKMTFKLKNNYRFLKHKLSAFHWYISCHDVKSWFFVIFWCTSFKMAPDAPWGLKCTNVRCHGLVFSFLHYSYVHVWVSSDLFLWCLSMIKNIIWYKSFVSDLFLKSGYSIPRSLTDDHLVWIWCSLSYLLPATLKDVVNSLSMFYRCLRFRLLIGIRYVLGRLQFAIWQCKLFFPYS